MRNYVVIIEECKNGGYSAYVPDLPGCISLGESIKEIEANIKKPFTFILKSFNWTKNLFIYPALWQLI